MAGIYIHVPFCKRICSYCDFYKTTFVSLIPEYLDALETELMLRKSYLDGDMVDTIYFGGGTPSLVGVEDIQRIIQCIAGSFPVSQYCEITIEANPDDLTPGYLRHLRQSTPVNRASIGVQSFNDEQLKRLNRRHTAIQARQCVEDAKKAGFANITVDLIYGLPGMTPGDWQSTLETAFSLEVQHLSAYHLTVEPNTAFGKLSRRGLLQLPGEEESASQFMLLHTLAGERGFEHYEISNLCREGYYSAHNTNYWRSKKYLGIGPAAHSYDIESRQWNIADVKKYISALKTGQNYYETEMLDAKTRYNEYIMVSLRTIWGVNTKRLAADFGETNAFHFAEAAGPFLKSGKLGQSGDIITMTPEAWLISDHILTRLMLE